jgi:hypothetical protein
MGIAIQYAYAERLRLSLDANLSGCSAVRVGHGRCRRRPRTPSRCPQVPALIGMRRSRLATTKERKSAWNCGGFSTGATSHVMQSRSIRQSGQPAYAIGRLRALCAAPSRLDRRPGAKVSDQVGSTDQEYALLPLPRHSRGDLLWDVSRRQVGARNRPGSIRATAWCRVGA